MPEDTQPLPTTTPEADPTPEADLKPATPVSNGKSRAAATFIFLTVALDMLALGMIVPVLPRLIIQFMHGNPVRSAEMLGVFGTVFAVMQFFCSPILGSLSDRFGRRPVVLLSNFGLGLDYVLMAWAPAIGWLFLGRVVSGVTASSIPTALAYIADVTPREKRAAAFGMLNAAFGIGFVLGPAVGGMLGNINPRLPFLVSAVLSLLNGCYGLFVLPESLTRENRTSFSWRRANPIGSLALLNREKSLIALSTLLLLGYIAQQSLNSVYVISADFRFHWTTRTVGLSLAVVGIFTGLYSALLVKPVVAAIGERRAIFFGMLGGAIGYTMFGLSKTGLLFWLGIPFLNLISLAWPAAQSMMSHEVSPSEQGQLQGAINSLRGLSGLIGPGLFTYVFSRSIGADAWIQAPGMPFYLAAALVVVAIVMIKFIKQPTPATA